MQRHVANTEAVAETLAANDAVSWVKYPSMPDHPDHELARRLYPRGTGAILSFGIAGGRDAGAKFISAVRLASHLANVGDAKTLVIHPASTTHQQMSPEDLAAAGVGEDLVRISVGLEDPRDIIEDLERALQRLPAIAGRAAGDLEESGWRDRAARRRGSVGGGPAGSERRGGADRRVRRPLRHRGPQPRRRRADGGAGARSGRRPHRVAAPDPLDRAPRASGPRLWTCPATAAPTDPRSEASRRWGRGWPVPSRPCSWRPPTWWATRWGPSSCWRRRPSGPRWPGRWCSWAQPGAMPVHPALQAAADADDPLAGRLITSWGIGSRAHTGGHASPGMWLIGGQHLAAGSGTAGRSGQRPGRLQRLRRRRGRRGPGCSAR